MDEIMQVDLYNLIGAEPTASVSEIKKAYRKKALTCHPDKNPDNPKAAELFHKLSKALEILTDEKTRAAYDQVITARKLAKERVKELDAKRRKLIEDLEAREEAYRRSLDPTYNVTSDEQRLKAEIERLEKEGSRQVEEEIAFVQKQIWEQLHVFRIKIKWKVQKQDSQNGGYNHDNLQRMFSKYGDVIALVVSSSKKGSAMVEFEDKSVAETALLTEVGLAENPLVLRALWDTSQRRSRDYASDTSRRECASPNCSSVSHRPDAQQGSMSDAEYENFVLANLRRAEERKRLIEELKTQEES